MRVMITGFPELLNICSRPPAALERLYENQSAHLLVARDLVQEARDRGLDGLPAEKEGWKLQISRRAHGGGD
jgi:hypothetical protein